MAWWFPRIRYSSCSIRLAAIYMRPESVHELSVDISRGETIMIEVRLLKILHSHGI